MFDIGFWELFLIFLLGLLVLGPERLPKVARTLGQWTGRARGYVRQLSAELDRELQTEEVKRQFMETNKAVEESFKKFQTAVPPETEASQKPDEKAIDPQDGK